MQNIAGYIDHTILKATTMLEEVILLCNEAKQYGFAAVCVPPSYVNEVKKILTGTDIKIATVVGFPLGYSTIASKIREIELAIESGADEIDMVHNIAALKNNNLDYLQAEIATCTEMVHANGAAIKIIIESGILTDEEIITCCKLYAPLHINFMKTSTGFAEKGASVHAVQIMREHLPQDIAIKASGGIKTTAFARELIAAGATRLGCSASIAIVKEDKVA